MSDKRSPSFSWGTDFNWEVEPRWSWTWGPMAPDKSCKAWFFDSSEPKTEKQEDQRAFTLVQVSETLNQYHNKDLSDVLFEHIKKASNMNGTIPLSRIEGTLKGLLSPETADWFCKKFRGI